MNGLVCSYATCRAPAKHRDEYVDWKGRTVTDVFCHGHYPHHMADYHPDLGIRPPDLPPEPDLAECGTAAAARRHHRRGEPLDWAPFGSLPAAS